MFQEEYDVIVVGAGHGSEAAAAAANLGSKTLITMSLQNIAQMSCNPAMGGIEGQIVRD
jgi:tRNA uridine 5-carboxymethylaminomethyl modification enzyme